MQIIADLHLHSKYSRAVSQKMDLLEIANWAEKKGINLVTTGDWTHPLWLREIKSRLKETTPGIYSLSSKSPVRFILTSELSSIYNQNGKIHRIHNLVFSPSIETVEKINKKLLDYGVNLLADGRPIMGISAKDLLKILLNIDKNILLVPCHAWTPWFSLYGSKSGFDSMTEAFGELENYIYAVETGLSSDPIMNWQIKELENRSILSFSDAHSGPKLGREATVFVPNKANDQLNINDLTYDDIIKAIKKDPTGRLKIGYTIEFFPEEGKYHWSGHRAHNLRYNPEEVLKKGKICPICKKPLTIGVENRVLDLAWRRITKKDLIFLKNKAGLIFVYEKEKKRPPFVSLVPLLEVLIEIFNSPTKALTEYNNLIKTLGTEFDILIKKDYLEIEKTGINKLKEAIKIIRERRVFVDPGYDGVFGVVKIFNQEKSVGGSTPQIDAQPTLF
ncbi:MAG: endonuclease Q family protein [Microgenomates group bacterium]|nr:endonuclease Q family protein [Microgenomates group bacterium]